MTQSLPRRWGSPSVDNSSRRGEQPQQAPGQTTVNQSTSPPFPLAAAAAPFCSLCAAPSSISTPLLRSVPTPPNLRPGRNLAVNIMAVAISQGLNWVAVAAAAYINERCNCRYGLLITVAATLVQANIISCCVAPNNNQAALDSFYLICNYHNDNYMTAQWHETN